MELQEPEPSTVFYKYPKFKYYGWETIYVEHQKQYLKLIDKYPDVNRLYLLMYLDFYKFDLVLTDLRMAKQYHKEDEEELQIIDVLKKSLKKADPVFLELAGEWFKHESPNALKEFIESILTGKKSKYPKLSTYNDNIETLNLLKSLTINFETTQFLKICPDPMDYILKAKTHLCYKFNGDKLTYLYDKFYRLPVPLIQAEFFVKHFHLLETVDALEDMMLDEEKYPESSENARSQLASGMMIYLSGMDDIDLLKEIAFVENKEAVEYHMSTEASMRLIELEEAKMANLIYICECCYETELLISEVYCCPKGHSFCLKCIETIVESQVTLKKLEIKCLTECTENLNLEMIKNIVNDKLCERIVSLEQTKEIDAANIENLESCTFCNFVASVPQDLKVFTCLNPKCGKELCRSCKKENHLPLSCYENIQTPEVVIRTRIENKMSEVLIRNCPVCKNRFLKDSGCNKIVCPCGTSICYICKKIITPIYEHFYHNRIMPNKCPLFTDENVVHVAVVEAAARLIIDEMRVTNPNLLIRVNMNKLLPKIKPPQPRRRGDEISVSIDNEVIAKILGENVQKINSLKDMRTLESTSNQ
ncbi:Zinc finger, RING/FYVE/PHD-type [Cinara cedri]|uniref:Zinc finger, RING/FYVE/PHD-type n=1 Tax=Cinara cedri TaxID=506608 RepID=A0A5E4N8P1_9HEMI|nr:Zinc finger, RING/FYVE/PHD-type [Cinara cedri]